MFKRVKDFINEMASVKGTHLPLIEEKEMKNDMHITNLPYVPITTRGVLVEPSFYAGNDTTRGLEQLESQYIEYIYKQAKYNQSKAAKMLGISRGCMRQKLETYWPGKYI